MRSGWFIFLSGLLPAIVLAQQAVPPGSLSKQPSSPISAQISIPDARVVPVDELDANSDQVQAATINAQNNLRDQILRTRLTRDLLVGDFLDRTASNAELTRILKGARPVGGARWVDDRTCQVQIELPGSAVSAMLMGIAHNPQAQSPVRPGALKARLSDWDRLTFSAVGSSAGGDSIELAKPQEASGQWEQITDSARRAAIAQARADAADQAIHLVEPLRLNPASRAGDLLARPLIAGPFNRWLGHRPITRIDFADDLKVSVTISLAHPALESALQAAVAKDPGYSPPQPIDWPGVNHQIEDLPTAVVGVAAAAPAPTASSLPDVVLPIQPPDWIDQQLQSEATASGTGGAESRLKIARTAEAAANKKLRDQFLELHLDSQTTLRDAAHADHQLQQAVDRALLHCRTYRVDYELNGSVTVKVSLDLRDAWDAMRDNP